MIDVTIPRENVNAERLHADLKAALGETCAGLSFANRLVSVHLTDGATAEQQDQARQIVQGHDPAALTPEQQANLDRDAHPFFTLTQDQLIAHTETLDAVTFQREMARAFAYLRDRVRGGR